MKARYAKDAAKALKTLPPAHRKGLVRKIEAFATLPETDRHTAITVVEGRANHIRVVQGKWRAYAEIREAEGILLVKAVGPRGEFYDRF